MSVTEAQSRISVLFTLVPPRKAHVTMFGFKWLSQLCLGPFRKCSSGKKEKKKKTERSQHVERSRADGQGNFQIKAGHAWALAASHKQLSHCGKKRKPPILIRFTSRVVVLLLLRGFWGQSCHGFYVYDEMAHTLTRAYTHAQTNINILYSY